MGQRSKTSPAMTASVVLHGVLLASVLWLKPWTRNLPIGTVVPVNIVSNASFTDLRAATQTEQVQSAQTETPVAEAPVEPASPDPTPSPAPPSATISKPRAPSPAKPEKTLDLDALAASIAKTAKPAGGKTSSASKGPARPETALAPRAAAGAGTGLSASAMSGLANELQRRWNPNCEVEGGKDVTIRVSFTLGTGGRLSGLVEAGGLESSTNPVVKAAAERAIRAVHQAAPFSTLPNDFFGQRISVNFKAREACG